MSRVQDMDNQSHQVQTEMLSTTADSSTDAEKLSENDSDLSEDDSELFEDDSETTWTPPRVLKGHLHFVVEDLMSTERHKLHDKALVDLHEILKGPWPAPEDVVKDPDTAGYILWLLVQTAAPTLALRPEWKEAKNLRAFAEQDVVRESLADAVRWKAFTRFRSLVLWYEGYDLQLCL
ncbi:hypothetical protein OBBRIDRAFT_807519 [Obba rivulosa]|uniref:Uncharacterized protein n=1 Tax=Obba rivulosa TaxID=1052685 RepID=A0A8E2ARN7_9APHY|nr:hypothetical protein OBBRIDRAFT_807519 [Obba rivulosa]